MSSQSLTWSKICRQPLESRRNLLPFKSYFQFRFGGRHLESVVISVGQFSQWHSNRGRAWPKMWGYLLAAGIAPRSLAVLKLFPLPVLLAAMLTFGSLPTSTNVGQRLACSENTQCQVKVSVIDLKYGAAFEIASQYPTVQKLFPLPVWWPPS